MGNKVCCDQTRTGGSLDNSENPPIRRVEEVPFNQPPPRINSRVQQTLSRQKFFDYERKNQNNPKSMRFGGDYYTGAFQANGARPNGFGRMYKNDGGFYIGFFQNGKAHGRGAYIFQDGSYYEGEFRQNSASTENGKYQSDDLTYEGGFRDNKFYGNAFERGKNYKFEGTFLRGSREKGQYKWEAEDGEYIYDGTFNDQNQFHGKGILQEPNGRYEGPFANGEKDGEFGTYYSQNGTKYEGSYSNGFRSGYGTVYNNQGMVAYKGELRRGLPHGTGSIYNNGKEMKTTWVDGIDYNLLPQSLQ